MSRRALCCVCVLVLVSGCAFGSRPWSLKEGDTPVSSDISTAYCAVIEKRELQLESARLLYDAAIERSGERHDVRIAFVFRRPGDARLEILPVRGAMSIGLAVFSNGNGTAIQPTEQRAIRSTSEKRLIEELLPGFSFTVRELLATLLAEVPQNVCSSPKNYRWSNHENGQLMVVESSTDSTWLLQKDATVEKLIRRDPDSPASPMYIDISRARASTGSSIPSEITVHMPSISAKVLLKLSQGTLNNKVSDRAVNVSIPEGYDLMVLD